MVHRMTEDGAKESEGCWIDGHWGQYAVAQMVEIAQVYGYDDSQIVDIARRHLDSMGPSDEPGITDDEHEMLSFAAQDVENWMNDNVVPEGYAFVWEDGELFLERTAEDEEDLIDA